MSEQTISRRGEASPALCAVLTTAPRWAGIVALCVCLVPVRGQGEGSLLTSAPVQPHYEGQVRLDYDYRSQGDSKDSDFYGSWYGGAHDLGNGYLDFYASGRAHRDLDGSSLYDGTFRSPDDARGVTENRLQQAYLDAHDRNSDLQVRLGRQYIDEADFLQLDGGLVSLFDNGKLGGNAYFGVPVSYYLPVTGDLAGGASLVGRPWTGNRTRFTYADYYDHSADQSDHNFFVDLQQELSDAVRTRAQASILNGDFRMAYVDCSYFAPDGSTDAHIGGSRWGEFDAKTVAYSPLYQQFGVQQPYTFLYAKLSYAITPKWMISPGISANRADDSGQNFSNRDYSDYDLTLIYAPIKALSTSVSLHYWNVDGGDSLLGLNGEIRYRYRRLWEISAGSAYVQNTYNSYSDIAYSINGGQTVFQENGTVTKETPYSLSYFLRTRWNFTPRTSLRLEGSIEDDKEVSALSYELRSSLQVRL